MNFKTFIADMQKTALSLQDNKEYIDECEAIKAYTVLENIVIQNESDIFLACTAINLLNAFANQTKYKLNYRFKDRIESVILAIESLNSAEIEVVCQKMASGDMIYLSFCGFQYSFQGVKRTEIIQRIAQNDEFVWDKIRKQKCAITLFKKAYNNPLNSQFAQDGLPLSVKVGRAAENYYLGFYHLDRGRLIFKTNKGRSLDSSNENLKRQLQNYYRDNLLDCIGQLVLLECEFCETHDNHITFINIKSYFPDKQGISLCDHINIYRPELERNCELESLKKQNIYVILGYCHTYGLFSERVGVELAEDLGVCPIAEKSVANIPLSLLLQCYRF